MWGVEKHFVGDSLPARPPQLPRLQRAVLVLTYVDDLADNDIAEQPANAAGGRYRFSSGATSLQKITGAPAHPRVLYLSGRVIVAVGVGRRRRGLDGRAGAAGIIVAAPAFGRS